MKSISFKVNRRGNGYVATAWAPNHPKTTHVSRLGVSIAGGVLLLLAGFLGFLILLATQ